MSKGGFLLEFLDSWILGFFELNRDRQITRARSETNHPEAGEDSAARAFPYQQRGRLGERMYCRRDARGSGGWVRRGFADGWLLLFGRHAGFHVESSGRTAGPAARRLRETPAAGPSLRVRRDSGRAVRQSRPRGGLLGRRGSAPGAPALRIARRAPATDSFGRGHRDLSEPR